MRLRAGEIGERLSRQAEQVAVMLLPNGKRQGQFWTAGDTGGSEGESLKVYLRGDKAGRWQDYATGEGGDLLDLWAASKAMKLADAMNDAADWLGVKSDPVRQPKRSFSKPKSKLGPLSQIHRNFLRMRMLDDDVVDRFGVQSEGDWLAFPYIDPDGELFAIKYRTPEKKMRSASDCRPGLYGWHAISDKARAVAIVEGELDAIALTHYGMATLSVPNGGGGDGKQAHWIEEEFDRLNRFDTIFLALDTDEPGQAAAAEIMDRLGPERCRIVTLPHKDANLCLQEGVTKEQMRDCFVKAKTVDPEELKRPSDFLNEIIDEFHGTPDTETGFSWPFKNVSHELRFRPEELIVVAGANGSGKSQFCGHLMLEAMGAGMRVCIASMEFKPRRYLGRLYRQATGIREPAEGYIRHVTDWLNDQLWVFDLVGTAKVERMLDVFRYARRRYGIKVFLIDNLAKCGFSEDDYNGQKAFIDALTDFAKQNEATVILVHHMRKGGEDKDGVKGTGAITDMADTVLIVWRNKPKEDALKKDPHDEEMQREYDGLISCRKQRNGESEPTKAIWFDPDSFQFLSGPDARAWRYCPDFSARAVA